MAENPVNAVAELNRGWGDRHSKISIFYLPREEDHYLSVENVTVDNRGKGGKTVDEIITLVKIDTETAETLMKRYGSKKPFFLEY